MLNRIYLGPADRQPHTVTGVLGLNDLLPGTFVTPGSGEPPFQLQVAYSGTRRPLILDFQDALDAPTVGAQPARINSPIKQGNSVVAYVPESGQHYQARFAEGDYSTGDPLEVDSNGRLRHVGAGRIVAYYAPNVGLDAPTFVADDDDLATVIIA
ncbi:MAG TPA: hypothetical protein PKC97_11595 [Burkholderiaceae bacterium]|nr:hypothetical protein [Burkholderiaceae bacterium]